MERNILLVEDTEHKRVKVRELLRELDRNVSLTEVESFNSGSRAIEHQVFDVAVIDMSLPTYDRSAIESGGKFRTLGGRELARKIVRKRQKTKIVFFTQYDSFSGINAHTLASLAALLQAECGENFGGLIHYDSSLSAWRDQLSAALK